MRNLSFSIDPSERENREAETVAVALAQLALSVRLEQQRQVCETWHGLLPSEGLVKHIVQRQGWKPLLTSDNLGDFHKVVIYNVCEVICREFVGSFPENFVIQGVSVYLDVSTDEVIHLHDGVYRHLEADGPAVCGLQQFLYLVFRQGEGVAELHSGFLVIDKCFSCSLCLSAFRFEFFCCIECIISITVLYELVCIFAINAFSLRLTIWSMRMSF